MGELAVLVGLWGDGRGDGGWIVKGSIVVV